MDKINYELRRYLNAVMRSIKVVTGKKIRDFLPGEKTFCFQPKKIVKKKVGNKGDALRWISTVAFLSTHVNVRKNLKRT